MTTEKNPHFELIQTNNHKTALSSDKRQDKDSEKPHKKQLFSPEVSTFDFFVCVLFRSLSLTKQF